MVDPQVIRTVRQYLSVLRQHDIPVTRAVVYGSHARGTARPESDIDVLVVSPAFDSDRWSRDRELWQLTLKVDPRIEPVPVGQRQFLEDQTSPIVEMARREGIAIDGGEN
jgi:predicted nucleotidyltransferase